MTDIVFQQILNGNGFCHEHGIVPPTDDECCPYCGATAHGVEMTRLAQETQAEIERLRTKLSECDGKLGRKPCQHERCMEYVRLREALEDAERVLAWGEPRPQPVLQRVRAAIAGKEGKLFRGMNRVERLETALRHISLASQSSMSSKEECGRIARAALAATEVK